MMPNDDQAWLDALAGRAPSGDDSPAAREAAGLREGILLRTVDPEPFVAPTDAAREDALIDRARRAGLIASPAASLPRSVTRPSLGGPAEVGTPVGRLVRRTPWRGLLAAAAVVGAVAVVSVVARRPALAPQTVRGDRNGIARLESDDPVRLQREILDELRRAGVKATGYESLGRRGIDADLPQPPSPELLAVLQRHALAVPADGVLRIEITGKGPPAP